jgi:hypothetical protein
MTWIPQGKRHHAMGRKDGSEATSRAALPMMNGSISNLRDKQLGLVWQRPNGSGDPTAALAFLLKEGLRRHDGDQGR